MGLWVPRVPRESLTVEMIRSTMSFHVRNMLRMGNLMPQTTVFWPRELYEQAGNFDAHVDRPLASDYDSRLRLARLVAPRRVVGTIGRTTMHSRSITFHSPDVQEQHAERVRRRRHAAWPGLPEVEVRA